MQAKYISPVVSALDNEGNYDFKANEKIFEFIIGKGINGIVLLGSSGEFFAFDMDTKKKIILHCKEYVNSRVPIIVGTGSINIEDTIELSQYCQQVGIKEIIVITPYYFNLSDVSIYDFYSRVAKSIDIDVYLYNYPDRTGYNIDEDVILKLLRNHRNIVGYKDSTGDPSHIKRIIMSTKQEFPGFKVFCGMDDYFSYTVMNGGDGAIGALSNVRPDLCSGLVNSFKENNLEEASLYQRKLGILSEIYTVNKPFVPAVKKAMVIEGIISSEICSFPINRLSEDQSRRIKQILESAKEIN